MPRLLTISFAVTSPLLFLLLLSAGCSITSEEPDAEPTVVPSANDPSASQNSDPESDPESETPTSTPKADSGKSDAGKTSDSGKVDSGKSDTGTITPPPDASPPKDASVVVDSAKPDTGPIVCNAVVAGYYVAWEGIRDYVPASMTWSGGTIANGRYELTSYVEYNGPSGAGGYASGARAGEGIEISGSSWQRSYRITGGWPAVHENYTAAFTGSNFNLSRTCTSGAQWSSSPQMHYSVTATGFVLFEGYGTTGSVSTYLKK